MGFNSRKKILDEIWTSLKGDHIRMIGISDVPGVHKTTFVTQIGKRDKTSSLFDVTIMAVVSQNLDFLYIQNRFAEIIGLTKFAEKTKEGEQVSCTGYLRRGSRTERRSLLY